MRRKKMALLILILAAAAVTLGSGRANAQVAFQGTFAGPHGGMSFRSGGGFVNRGFADRSFVSRRSFVGFPRRHFIPRPFGFARRHFVSRRFFVAFPFPHYVVRRVFVPVPVGYGSACGYGYGYGY